MVCVLARLKKKEEREMKKENMIDLVDLYSDEDGNFNLKELLKDVEELEQERIEELEERQSQCGFYSFQDEVDMWKFER